MISHVIIVDSEEFSLIVQILIFRGGECFQQRVWRVDPRFFLVPVFFSQVFY